MMSAFEIDWPLWTITMIPLVFSAGPGNLMVAASGARSGVRGSIAFIFGLDGTYLLLAVAVGLGLGQLIQAHPFLTAATEVLGITYIFYLAWRLWVAEQQNEVDASEDFRFRDGVIVQLTNTKGMVMLMVMFSEFVAPSAHVLVGVLAMSFALVGLNFTSHLIWASFGVGLECTMRRNPHLRNGQKFIFAAMMFGVGVWLAMR